MPASKVRQTTVTPRTRPLDARTSPKPSRSARLPFTANTKQTSTKQSTPGTSRTSQGYHTCKAQYHRGIFDAVTGKELDGKSRFKEGGYQIDLATYKVIEPDQ